MINIIFIGLALVGAVLAFGPNLLEMGLAGIASIDFISVADVVVFGIMLAIVFAVCAFWATTVKHERYKSVRVITWFVMGLVTVAYAILFCSMWADGWLAGYQNWLTASAKYLQLACYAGWLFMVCSAGWCARAIYERYFKPTGAHENVVDGK